MNLEFNGELASVLKTFSDSLGASPEKKQAFVQRPTASVKAFLHERGVNVPNPDLFHAHAIKVGETLPSEPVRATRDRYIYVYRASGLFEFKAVPGSPDGDDSIMLNPKGACCCCNCCVIEV